MRTSALNRLFVLAPMVSLAMIGCQGSQGDTGAAGTSTGSIAVTVLGPDGAALAGAAVSTVPSSSSATTGTDGKATLAKVPIGSWLVTANKTGLKADGAAVSVVAGGTVSATLHLSNGTEFALARVVGIPSGYQDLLPGGEVRFTSNNASKSGYDIKPGGVPNVAVGSYVYIQAASEDAAGSAISAQTWSIGSDVGSGAKLEYWDPANIDTTKTPTARIWDSTSTGAANVRFRPDVPGVYTVTVTATASGVQSTYHLRVYAGTYVGVSWCASCHSNPAIVGSDKAVYQEWSLTGHATKFEKTYSMYSSTSDYCVQCHTTGYDESTVSGFDDMARQSGWDPTASSMIGWAKGSWPTISAFISDPVTQPMQKLMNIQCESCHGPGSNHPAAASHLTWDPAVCAQCHGQPAQWAMSGHAKPVSPSEWGSASCMPCHSGQGFVVSKVQGKPIVFPNQSFEGYPATVFEKGLIQGIGCVTCHDPHLGTGAKSSQLRLEETTFTAPMGFTVTAGESAACKTCHVDKRDTTYFNDFLAAKQSRGPHVATQVDMLSGHGGAEYTGKSYGSSTHTSSASECATCHMFVTTYAPVCNIDLACTDASLKCTSTNTTNGYCGCSQSSDCPNPAQACSHGKCTDQYYGGHTFSMTYTTGADTYDHVTACTQCHGGTWTSFDKLASDWAGGGSTQVGVQTQVETLLVRLGGKLMFGGTAVPEKDINKLSPKPTATQLRALWDYWFVKNDGSKGIHNTKYAIQLLCDSLKALDASDPCVRP